jgi:hypothetical protein
MHRLKEWMRFRHASGYLTSACLSRPVRNLAFLFVLLLGVGGAGLAGQTHIGVQGGLSIPNIRGGNNVQSMGFTSRKGPYFGLFADFSLAPHFSFRAEINYASQGGKRDGMQAIITDLPTDLPVPPGLTLYADFHNETILDYIEIPLLAEYSWGNKPRFYVNAGPYVGFLLRAKVVTSGQSSLYLDASGTPLLIPPDYQPLPPRSFDATTDVKQDINSTNAGIAGGAGLALAAGPGDILFTVHFSLGLANIQRDVELNGKNHTGAVVVTVGYACPLGSKK